MEKLLRKIYGSEKKKKCLSVIGKACVFINVAFFATALLILALGEDWSDAAVAAAAAALGYGAVTVARKLVKSRRPYEVYDFYTVKPREKQGESFPSRHCYSAFVIATLTWLVSPLASAALLLVGCLLALTRVLLGIHFVRDVVCGGLAGIAMGAAGVVISRLI